MNRPQQIQEISTETAWDIIIAGGGATGLGAAVDAASRGYKTLLLEKFDFAKGTSSRSTKLVHGGVRYLEQGNIKLVKEALRERGWLLKNAPHLTHTMPFIIPAYGIVQKYYYGLGLKAYDFLSGKLSLGKTEFLTRQKTIDLLPTINASKLKGGVMYFDGQFDDARLAIDLAKTAVQYGATVCNYISVLKFIKSKQKICGLVAEDAVTGKTYELKAKAVINATGVFADELMQADDEKQPSIITPSQGIHLVVDKKFFPGNHALMIPKTDDKRVLFAVPWHNKVVLGTTDTPINGISEEPEALDEEIDFVMHHANRYLSQTITENDVKSIFAGLRPLVKQAGTKSTALLNRDHTIIVSKSNLVTITGGKWTTYRKMAEDAVDNAAFVAKLDKRECVTMTLLIGNCNAENSYPKRVSEESVLTYNEIKYFIEEEMAQTVEDILSRRIRLLLLDAEAAISMAPHVAKEMAAVMNKDEIWIEKQVKEFTAIAEQYVL